MRKKETAGSRLIDAAKEMVAHVKASKPDKKRDPRRDPRRDDVLLDERGPLIVGRFFPKEKSILITYGIGQSYFRTLKDWRKGMKGATVLHVCPPDDPFVAEKALLRARGVDCTEHA